MRYTLRLGLFLALFDSLIIFPSTVLAQSYVFGRADFGAGKEPRSLAVGDFNGDGKLDLVVANRSDNTVSILLGKPDGTFTSKVDYATGPKPISVLIGDFNGDGNLDLAVANENCTPLTAGGFSCGAGSLSILLGNGDGTFQPHVDYALGTRPISVAVGDLNGDGKLDLAVANNLDSTLSVLLGNGDGTFQTRVDHATAPSPQSVIPADFNGDGKLDLAVGTADSVSILLGRGDGTFQNHTDFLVEPGTSGASLSTGDFNGDGKLDLAAAGSGAVNIMLGNGDGTFVLAAAYPTGSAPVAVISADFNGDGKLDLAIANQGGDDSVSILLGNGDGTFQAKSDYGTGLMPSGIVASDFNGDGKLDLAVADASCSPSSCVAAGSVSVLLGLGNGTFVGKTDYGTASGPLFTTSADLNGDGKLDLAVANQIGDSVSILLGNGDGTFQPQASFPTGHLPIWVIGGDFNGDGKIDLAVVNQTCTNTPCGPGSVSILLGNGDGTFRPHVDYLVGIIPFSLAVGDFNGDGKLDLAVANNGLGAGNTVSILLGNGDGTFRPHVDYLAAAAPVAVVAGDFNKDGKVDLAVANGTGTVSVLLGNGDGTFQAHVDYPTPGGAYSMAVGDFNGDGSADLAVGTDSPVVSILLGNGDGTFQPHVDYPSSGLRDLVNVGDFNGDGKLDLAVGLGISSRASILLGNGDGTFRPPVNYMLANSALGAVAAGDFDGDGGLDLAGADGNTDTVSVILNIPFKAVYPAAITFGSQGVGTTSAVQTLTLSNPSGTSFNLAGIATTGDYLVASNCGASLLPASSCTINIRFSPTTTGVRTGTITLVDSTRSSPQVIPLTGTGVNSPFLSLSQTSLKFGSQAVGTTTAPKTVVLANTGDATLSITSIVVTGADSADFSQSGTCGSSLSTGSNCTVGVTFAPTAGGARTGAITITDNAPGSPHLVDLTGIGLVPQVSLSGTSLTFTSQIVVTTSPPQTVTLSNTGGATLNVTQISVSGDFAQTNNCGTSLVATSSCQISVAFTPTAGGTRSGTLTINDNAPGSPHTVALSGTGQDFSLAPSGQATATIMPGQTANYTLAVTPVGGFNQTVALSCSGAPAQSTCSVSPNPLVLNGSAAGSIAVKVTTTAASLAMPTRSAPRRYQRLYLVAELLVLSLVFALLNRRPRRRPRLAYGLALLLVFCAGLMMSGCGGGSSSGGGGGNQGTPAGTYTIVVLGTFTSGATSLTHSVNLNLVVQ